MGRLDVVLADRSQGGAGLVSVRYLSWPVVAGVVAGTLGLGALFWWLYTPSRFPSWLIVIAVVIPNVVRQQQQSRMALTDPVLADATVRAALALGREVKPGTWRITGPQARALHRELRRLHHWWTPQTGIPSARAAAREQELLAEAKPELRAFMTPTLPPPVGAEPSVADVRSHEDGEPWPVLPPREP